MRAVLIGNRGSSRSHLFDDARARLTARGVAIDEAVLAKDSKEALRCVRRAIKRGATMVVVGGGDGTLTHVVGAFAHADAILGVLPLGTGNSFALSLGIQPDLDAAVDAIVDGQCKRVDLGIVNKTYFANFATIGLSADIAGATPKKLKSVIGTAAYAVAGIKPLLTHRAFHTRIRWKKHRLDLETHQIVVANGRFFGRTAVLPDARIDDGELALFTTSGTRTFDVAKAYLAMFMEKQTDLSDSHYFSAEKISIKTSPRVALAIDGEVIGRTPARFSIARRALRVMVPA